MVDFGSESQPFRCAGALNWCLGGCGARLCCHLPLDDRCWLPVRPQILIDNILRPRTIKLENFGKALTVSQRRQQCPSMPETFPAPATQGAERVQILHVPLTMLLRPIHASCILLCTLTRPA